MPGVLIVEDEPTVRDLLCEILGHDYECSAVGTAEEGLGLLASGGFDAAVTDVRLPGLSGEEFLLRAHELSPSLPVIVVTAASVQERDGARLLFARLTGGCKKLRRLWVDGGYRGSLIGWVAARFGIVLEPVLRTAGQAFVVLPRRWVVERTFAWLGLHRRLSRDYERLEQTSEAMIYIAMTRLMLRRLKPL